MGRWSFPEWADDYTARHYGGRDDVRRNINAEQWRSAFREGWDTPGVYTVHVNPSFGLSTKLTLIIPPPEDYRVVETRKERLLT